MSLQNVPQVQVRVTPAIVDVLQTPPQITIDGAQGYAGPPLKATMNASPAAVPQGQRLNQQGNVRITGDPGGVEVRLVQRLNVSYRVTGVRVDYLAG